MTPHTERATLDDAAQIALGRRLAATLRGDVAFDAATRAVYATDSSNYRQVPLGVVFPRDADGVVSAMHACASAGAPVTARGGGTALAGQAVNTGVIIDFSRYMTSILEVDNHERLARVQPGVVLDDLRAAAQPYGLTFGPDPATHAWCTIGGMIGNNSCGTHSLYTGKTVDNVRRLKIVTSAGSCFWVGRYPDADYARAVAAGGELARILGGVREVGRRYRSAIQQRFPDIPRRVSGYNLDQVLPGRPTNLARLIVGSESTLALVVEAELELAPVPAVRQLVVLGFRDLGQAADAVPALVEFGLLALEGFDQTLVRQSAAAGLNEAGISALPSGEAWLLAEIGGDDHTSVRARVSEFVTRLPRDVNVKRVPDPGEAAAIWAVRESGLEATARPRGKRPNLEGWEDAAVPPAKLGEYLRRIMRLWTEYGYEGAWYGHFGDGCVHTRNPFDFSTTEGLAKYRSYVERAADIVVALGGSLSGEHGDGQARGELLVKMYGPEIITAFREVKSIFDPQRLLNPGKVVDPYPLDTFIKHSAPHHRWERVTASYHLPLDEGNLSLAVERCVGVGRCRRDDSGTICPSYRVTRDERHSTRGRAKAFQEMFRGEVSRPSWRNRDVYDALSLCLSCKACAAECPTGVDMATYKSEFHARYFRHRIRPRHMYALGLLPWLARILSLAPRSFNRLARLTPVASLLQVSAGLTRHRPIPPLANKPFRRLTRRAASANTSPPPSVVLWPDTFTNTYHPALAEDTIAVLRAVGETVHVPAEWACCGRTLYDPGMLSLARRTLRKTLDVLNPHLTAGIPVVVPEPSCLASFRHELPQLLPEDPRAHALSKLARSLSGHLLTAGALDTMSPVRPHPDKRAVLIHPHCHGNATGATPSDRQVLAALGYDVTIADSGCCGLAGSFGFAEPTAALGHEIGEKHWLPRLTAQATGRTIAMDGFSCTTQYQQLGGAGSVETVASLIRRALDAPIKPDP